MRGYPQFSFWISTALAKICFPHIVINQTKILDKESVEIKRKIKEAIHIRRQHPMLNRDGGYDLPAIFNHWLSRD